MDARTYNRKKNKSALKCSADPEFCSNLPNDNDIEK